MKKNLSLGRNLPKMHKRTSMKYTQKTALVKFSWLLLPIFHETNEPERVEIYENRAKAFKLADVTLACKLTKRIVLRFYAVVNIKKITYKETNSGDVFMIVTSLFLWKKILVWVEIYQKCIKELAWNIHRKQL